MSQNFQHRMDALKNKLILMASHAESAVQGGLRALMKRDDDLARKTREEDGVIDRLELEIDEAAILLLADHLDVPNLRMITTAMKIAHDLERIGDEATTISRRTIELGQDPPLRHVQEIPPMGELALCLLKDSLDAFVRRDPAGARRVIPEDKVLDAMNKRLQRELAASMAEHPETISRCLNLMVIAKSLERIGDHAKNIAEMVVYLCEGQDIRHRKDGGAPVGAPVGGG